MLDIIFKKFALKKEHATVYLTLLENGLATAGNLSKKLNIPRATLYGLLYDLNQKGLVIRSEKNAVKIWQAIEPEKILDLLNQNITALEEIKNNFSTILPDLKNKQRTDFIAPNFQYFEGADGVKQILNDILMYRDIKTESFWPIQDILEVFGKDYFANLNRKRIKQNIYVRAIWPRKKAVDVKDNPFLGSNEAFKREIRIAPLNIDCSMGYWAYKNKVAFISSKKEGFGFIVESAELAQLLKTQFEILWNMSKKLIVKSKSLDEFLKTITN